MIPFNKVYKCPTSLKYIKDAIDTGTISGNGKYTKKCSKWMEATFHASKVFMTTSCTDALEMTALLLNISPGDEVIMPAYTFVSTANAFLIHGAIPVFVDIRPDTMNIDENLIEQAISPKTKAIVVVHYAGISCEMEQILDVANKFNLPVIEDAAQAFMSKYHEKYLGTIGTFGCYSFHETKNYTMGEGGALVINDNRYIEKAEIIWEKGTNRSKFYQKKIDKYTWVDKGSSFLPSDINTAYLYAQLETADKILNDRVNSWVNYYDHFNNKMYCTLPFVPKGCRHNGHLFYLKLENTHVRSKFIEFMNQHGIEVFFHYVPLHTSIAGKKYSKFIGIDNYTTKESERLVRLPMWYGMKAEEINEVFCTSVEFFRKEMMK